MRWFPVLLLTLFCLAWASTADADPKFWRQWEKYYTDPDSTDPAEQAWTQKVRKARCTVCHVGRDKKNKNHYGMWLSRYLDRDAHQDDNRRIIKTMEVVENASADPNDEDGISFGELFRQKRLPTGE